MTYDEAVPIVEGRLKEYGIALAEFPGPVVSSLSAALQDMRDLGTTVRTHHSQATPQERWERWARRYRHALEDAPVIETVMRRLPELERRFVELRYWGRARSTREVAKELHMSDRAVRYLRERVIMAFALGWELLDRTG